MGDMAPLQELTDEKLAALASKRSAIEISRARVDALETKIRDERAAHDRRFGYGQTSAPGLQENLQRIDRLQQELLAEQKRVDVIEMGAGALELKIAMETAPEESFLYEVLAPDGRRIRQTAVSSEALQRG